MLGLGDIVVPGLVVAIALRFDYALALKRADGRPPLPSARYPRRYFRACLGGYVAGLATTFAVRVAPTSWRAHSSRSCTCSTPPSLRCSTSRLHARSAQS